MLRTQVAGLALCDLADCVSCIIHDIAGLVDDARGEVADLFLLGSLALSLALRYRESQSQFSPLSLGEQLSR